MKLLYICERRALATYGQPFTFDRYVSMDHGPVLSSTYNLMNGCSVQEFQEPWDACFEQRQGHAVKLRENCKLADTTAIRIIVQDVWREFGHFEPWQLVDYTHHQFKEWSPPHGSSKPIPLELLLQQVGYDEAEALSVAEGIEASAVPASTVNKDRLEKAVTAPVLQLSAADDRETIREKIIRFADSD